MSFTRSVAKNSIRKLFSEKWNLSMFLLIPLMMGGLFSLISGSSGQPKPQGILLITDHDKSLLSQLLIGGFSQGPMAEMFITKNIKSIDAAKIMDEGKASVWLEIEKGFTQNFFDEKPTTIKLTKNPSQTILPQIAETAVEIMADGGHYIQLIFNDELKQLSQLLRGEKVSDANMALMSIQIKHTIENLEQQLMPPLIKAVKKRKIDKPITPSKSFIYLLFPGILFMSLLFSSQALALEFWRDKTQGIIRRLMASPSGLDHYLNGNLLASLFIYIFIAILIGSLGLILLGLAYSKIFMVMAWLMLSGLLLGNMMLIIVMLMPTQKSASVVTSAMVFPLLMLGGSFFPFEAMPNWMVSIGQYLPNGYLLHHFTLWFLYDKPLMVLLFPASIAVALTAVLWRINHSLLNKFARK